MKPNESELQAKCAAFFNPIGRKLPFTGATRNGCLRIGKRSLEDAIADGVVMTIRLKFPAEEVIEGDVKKLLMEYRDEEGWW